MHLLNARKEKEKVVLIARNGVFLGFFWMFVGVHLGRSLFICLLQFLGSRPFMASQNFIISMVPWVVQRNPC